MNQQSAFVSSNADYDQDQIRESSRRAQSQATENPGFVFVNYGGQNDEAQKKTSRKLIRSKATAYSHRVAPRGTVKPEINIRALRSENDGSSSRRPSLSSMSDAQSFTSSSTISFEPVKRGRQSSQPEDDEEGVEEFRTLANVSRKRTIHGTKREWSCSDTDRALSPGPFETSLPDPLVMDASMRDPFYTYPVRYRGWYGQLINYWYSVVLPRSTRVIKATKSDLDRYTMWSRKQEMSEPVLFYTSLFLASGIPVAEGLFPIRAALWLRQKAVQAMQEALGDPERATSIPVILAVGRIALHEHIYGNRELAHSMHRPAQLRMITMRGGLANLGLPPTTVQLIVWTDALMSAETNTTPYFADVPKQIAIQSYSPEEAIRVTNYSSPHRLQHPGYDREQPSIHKRSKKEK